MNAKRIYLIKIAPVVLLAGTAYWLLGSDFFAFLTWWEMLFLLGLVFMPVTSRMFRGFDDNGWMFSKVLAVAVCGYAQWLLACLKITPFTGITCVILTVICCLGSLLYGIKCKNRFPDSLPWKQAALVYREEILLINTKTEGNTFTKKIGQTVYVVRYHFNEDSKETMQEKINRMLVTEVSRMAMY